MNHLISKENIPYQRLLQKHFPSITEFSLIQEILEYGQVQTVSAGTVILEHGNYVKGIPLVLEGIIKVSRTDALGKELFLHYIRAGETCSVTLTCCRIDKKSQLKSIAEAKTTLINVPVKYMEIWMNKYPSWKNFVMLSYDQRLNQLIEVIDMVAFEKTDSRLLKYLEQKSEAINSTIIHTTHAQIALDLNASREAISRLLKQMEKDGILELGRNKIELKIRQDLQDLQD
jgi:CRP/FNR family transcriptional regulator